MGGAGRGYGLRCVLALCIVLGGQGSAGVSCVVGGPAAAPTTCLAVTPSDLADSGDPQAARDFLDTDEAVNSSFPGPPRPGRGKFDTLGHRDVAVVTPMPAAMRRAGLPPESEKQLYDRSEMCNSSKAALQDLLVLDCMSALTALESARPRQPLCDGGVPATNQHPPLRPVFLDGERERMLVRLEALGLPGDDVCQSTCLSELLHSGDTLHVTADTTVRPCDPSKLNVVKESRALVDLCDCLVGHDLDCARNADEFIRLPDGEVDTDLADFEPYFDPALRTEDGLVGYSDYYTRVVCWCSGRIGVAALVCSRWKRKAIC